jgi:transcriptional regulator with XRE-family HTH domain
MPCLGEAWCKREVVIERRDFGAWLRRERERRNMSLDFVAEQTKINVALLAGLERGDLARWPAGIFRRAFVRAYAVTVGLEADAVMATFVGLFPEEGHDGVVSVPAFQRQGSQGDPLRLTLASGPTPSPRMWLVRSVAAALDAIAVSVVGALAASTGLVSFSVAALCVATVYFSAGTLLAEGSPGWWFSRRWLRLKPPVVADEPSLALTAAAVADDDDEHEPRRASSDLPLRGGRRDRRAARHERQRIARTAKRAV